MDLNWSADGSSSFIQWDDDDAGTRAEARNAVEHQLVPSSRQNGLLAIDDSDFQALIEILGTDGDRNGDMINLGEQVRGGRLLLQNQQHNDLRHNAQSGVAPDVHDSNVARTRSQNDVPRSMSLVPSRFGELSSSPRATGRPKIPTSPEPSRQTGSNDDSEGLRARRPDRYTPRASNPGPSRPPETSMVQFGNRLKPNAGFTQSKQYLSASVVDVKDQVSVLREQLQYLKAEVREFAPHLYRRAFDDIDAAAPPRNGRNSEEKRASKGKEKVVQWSKSVNGGDNDSGRDLIASLTEDEAKNALANVCHTLRIDLLSLVSASEVQKPEAFAHPSNLSDVARALKLVSDVDEIVWRNRRLIESGSATNIYDEENLSAILDRVRLWERTARSRTSWRPGP